ncbi:hypothetical protein DPMN_118489 [Dreissena polymorpha]|uniref:Uncharacterized protein n=1 Tax=Dreissena polymorpha TaxID=45954 RepID=A0A9D4JNJ7_DREPO|nr:hypothetical protein DPMN_118489 [Dreissena polymorpha]
MGPLKTFCTRGFLQIKFVGTVLKIPGIPNSHDIPFDQTSKDCNVGRHCLRPSYAPQASRVE